MTAENRYAPESDTALFEQLRTMLADTPLSSSNSPRPAADTTDESAAAVLTAALKTAAPASVRVTVAVRDVDGIAPGHYEFRDGALRAVENSGEPGSDALATVVFHDWADDVHAWRHVLLAAGAMREIARSSGFSLRPAARNAGLSVQAWEFAPAAGAA
ncbi:hypothetical protein F9C11_26680 [Amycolatopsis sp. VS8301801F10]|uniref:hypothetical protein n=1 Tax=Amycolatopsis sp. VS8301801F10 TaxID=2652442 RepID=UPI0038FCF415